ncbi:hypothetical protein OG470_29275 [Micromonospora sp. NBC_00389]|uniref:hypothetical protein n=1 Tax=Micromonospora sp. NBC_00389 TaxID=2903586 RepID=UPI002E1CF745
MASIRALVLNCTLKPSPVPSSSEQLGREVLAELTMQGVDGEMLRVVDHDVQFGVSTDEGDGDGAHHTIGQVQQALNEVGFTCAGAGATYWVGEALHTLDYQDAGPKPDTTGRTTKTLALNSAHLARLLAEQPYPPPDAKGAGREPA